MAVTVIGKEPVWVGVPESVPFVARVRPAGSVPEASANVAAPVPPVWVNVSLNALLAVPFELAGLFTVIVGQVMTRL